MSNTIELLEAIGQDASLRHASNEGLSHALSGLNASDALMRAVANNDTAPLKAELGHKDVKTPNAVNQFAPEGDDDANSHESDPKRTHDDDKESKR